MQSTCSSSLQRTLKPKQLLVDVSSLSSYVHSAPATGACTPTLSTQQASLNLCAKTCPGFSSCFLVAVEASSHRSYSSVAVCASSDSSLWSSPHNESSMCTAMGVAVWRARALRVIDWIGVFSGTLGGQTLHACQIQRISLHLEHLRVNSVTTPICFIHVEYVVIGVVTERGVPSQVKSAVHR